MGSLDGRTIVVTGGGSGLGRALTLAFADQGAHVAIIGRRLEALEETVRRAGPHVEPFAGDLSIAGDVERIFHEIEARYGHVDVLINNAAIVDFFRIDEADPTEIAKMINANLLGPLLTAHYAVPIMRKSQAADIVNISSESVRNPFSFLVTYAATKAGLENATTGLRAELRKFGIRVATLQVGILADPEREHEMQSEIGSRFLKENKAALAAANPKGMELSTVTQAIIAMLTLPRDATFEMVELRAH